MKYIALSFLLLLACNSPSEPKPERSEFTLTYRCVVNDPEIETVEIVKATYYPDGAYTMYKLKNFDDSDFSNGIEVIDTVYVGCTREAYFSVIKDWGSPQRKYWKHYLLKKDTIKSEADSLYQFIYPQDTVKAVAYKTDFDKDWIDL